MTFTDSQENPFIIGDPVQSLQNKNIIGRVCSVTSRNERRLMVYVELIGRRAEVAYYPSELQLCKCVTRIPEGVSKCLKKIT
jgi:hypothetical protein